MTTGTGFAVAFAVTLALLAAVVVTGFRAMRRWHAALVVAALASLGLTIGIAERVGERYDLAAAGAITSIHLALAKTTALAYALPLASGVLTTFRPRVRTWHRRIVWTVLALTVLSSITGLWMLLAAAPLAPRANL